MRSLRRHEGYLLIDNSFAVRNSPNPYPSDADLAKAKAQGLTFPGIRTSMFESATITCTHCNTVVVLNPDRSRERGYCAPCDHYICDGCSLRQSQGVSCVPLAKQYDIIQTQAERDLIRAKII